VGDSAAPGARGPPGALGGLRGAGPAAPAGPPPPRPPAPPPHGRIQTINRAPDAGLVSSRSATRVRLLQTWSFASDLLYLEQCSPEVGQPAVLVLADQAHAPGKSVAAAACDARVHQGVQD
jgi:hypothetical protein